MKVIRASVPPAEVVWHYLSHEVRRHDSPGRHLRARQEFGLREPAFPADKWTGDYLLRLLPLIDLDSSQRWTVLFAGWPSWEERAITVHTEFENLCCMVGRPPYDESPAARGVIAPFPEQLSHWRAFLAADRHPRAAGDRGNHAAMLATLEQVPSDERIDVLEAVIFNLTLPRGEIMDGGHRSLAAYDFATREGDRQMEISAFCAVPPNTDP